MLKQLFMAGITDGKEAFACLKKEFDLAAAELNHLQEAGSRQEGFHGEMEEAVGYRRLQDPVVDR